MITYLEGDATSPVGEGPKIIAHCCNNMRKWGRGFVLAISAKWEEPEAAYRAWGEPPYQLGSMQLVPVERDREGSVTLWVANIIGQHDNVARGAIPPIRYGALEAGLDQVGRDARRFGASVHMPRIGCGLAGGKWKIVEPIIKRTMADVPVFVYDFLDATAKSFVPAVP